MRSLSAWIAGAAGGLAAWRLLARRRTRALEAAPAPAGTPTADPRAEELRAKVEQTLAASDAPGSGEAEPGAGIDPDERRRQVHDAARAALDEMRDGR